MILLVSNPQTHVFFNTTRRGTRREVALHCSDYFNWVDNDGQSYQSGNDIFRHHRTSHNSPAYGSGGCFCPPADLNETIRCPDQYERNKYKVVPRLVPESRKDGYKGS